jgi:hypothetical protein
VRRYRAEEDEAGESERRPRFSVGLEAPAAQQAEHEQHYDDDAQDGDDAHEATSLSSGWAVL